MESEPHGGLSVEFWHDLIVPTHDTAKQRLNTLTTMALRWGSDMIQLCQHMIQPIKD